MKYLITGVAGFIGFHLAKRLLDNGQVVVGIDNLNDYYDVQLKYARLQEFGVDQTKFKNEQNICSSKYPNFQFIKIDIADMIYLNDVFESNNFDIVCNLAAQAGVTYSTVNPDAYIHSNVIGFINILECCKTYRAKLIYASSSSVYGENKKLPFSEADPITMPKNLYAKTKISNEYLAQMYSDHFNLNAVGLRFFSVYGTYGRPDMVMMIFADAMLKNLPLKVYGDGTMKRDYTFVEDVVSAIEKIITYSFENNKPNEIFNIGSSNPISLLELIEKLECQLKVKAIKNFLPQRPEEIDTTYADCSKLENLTGYKPKTSIDNGICKFVEWVKEYLR